MICYKVLKIANGFVSSSHHKTRYKKYLALTQSYFKDRINYPIHENTELFVFKDLERALFFAKYEISVGYKVVIWKCSCPSIRKISPGFDVNHRINEYWQSVKKIRAKKKAVNDIELNKLAFRTTGIPNSYSTPYLSFIETVWESWK